jgi:hypothetical protein
MTNLPTGMIRVTNNLARGVASLSGRANRLARGHTNDFINMPPGQYVTTWSAVPFYETPAPQTNVLDPESILQIEGIYTFPDLNSNGMSDPWELAFFDEISFERDCYSDFDLDGFTDCAEFAAGTDPTNPSSILRLQPPTLVITGSSKLFFRWGTVPGRLYELQGTRDFNGWIPLSLRLQATTTNLSTLIPLPEEFDPDKFRVEVWP